MLCPLCEKATTRLFADVKTGKEYGQCPSCDLRFLDQAYWLSPAEEKSHYDQHKNDADDSRYQDFVRPVQQVITREVAAGAEGLDYGCGRSSALARMLQSSYSMHLYDPIYWPDEAVLKESYDFIVASEVAEHFHRPRAEFQKLFDTLRPQGLLVLMTLLVTERTDFQTWYYRTDPTHVVFYSEKTVAWIKQQFGFSTAQSDGRRVVIFTK